MAFFKKNVSSEPFFSEPFFDLIASLYFLYRFSLLSLSLLFTFFVLIQRK